MARLTAKQRNALGIEGWSSANPDPANLKRCRTCDRLKPIREFQLPRHRQCLTCRQLQRDPHDRIVPLPIPKPPPKPRGRPGKPGSLVTTHGDGWRAYMRERQRQQRAAKLAASGREPPPPKPMRSCMHCCPIPRDGTPRRVISSTLFATPGARVCVECEALAPRYPAR